jgi:hypothetical protein
MSSISNALLVNITQNSFHEVVRPITYSKGPVDVVVSYTGFYLKTGENPDCLLVFAYHVSKQILTVVLK